jgi:hypothetical protein
MRRCLLFKFLFSLQISGTTGTRGRSGPLHQGTAVFTKAPKTARWCAIDCNGKAHWFVAPNVAAFTDFWFAEPKPAPDFGFIGDWRKSLVEQPFG